MRTCTAPSTKSDDLIALRLPANDTLRPSLIVTSSTFSAIRFSFTTWQSFKGALPFPSGQDAPDFVIVHELGEGVNQVVHLPKFGFGLRGSLRYRSSRSLRLSLLVQASQIGLCTSAHTPHRSPRCAGGSRCTCRQCGGGAKSTRGSCRRSRLLLWRCKWGNDEGMLRSLPQHVFDQLRGVHVVPGMLGAAVVPRDLHLGHDVGAAFNHLARVERSFFRLDRVR